MPLITISQNPGSEGIKVARLVADGLSLKVYDDVELEKISSELGIHAEYLKGLDEKAPGLFNRILSDKPELYLDYMENIVYEVARQGEGVIMGHGSQMLLRDFGCAFHVRVHASELTRLQNIIDQHGLSREAAKKLMHKIDDQQKGFFKFAFHMEWDDPSLYDLIINTEKMGVDAAVKLIVEATQTEDISTCSLNARLAQEKKIHAALLKNNIDTSTLNVEVTEKGVVNITGLYNPLQDQASIVKVVEGISGITGVSAEVTPRTAQYFI
jgi:cytidylate kinase